MFRNCFSATNTGHDVFINEFQLYPQQTFCDSTSPSTSRIVERWGSDYSNLLQSPANSAKVVSLTSIDMVVSGSLTLTFDKPASGTFYALLDNSFGTERTDPALPPNIGRLVTFTFSGGMSKTLSVQCGDQYLLQSRLDEYMLHAVSCLGWDVVQPTFKTVDVTLDETGTFYVFTLTGKDILDGAYTVILNDTNQLHVAVSTDYTGESVGVGSIATSIFDKGRSPGTNYTIVAVLGPFQSHLHIVKPGSAVFQLPAAAYLGQLKGTSFLDAAKTQLQLTFESGHLEKNKKHTLVLRKSVDDLTRFTFEIWTDSDGHLLPLDVTLDPYETDPEEKKKKLQLGATYAAVSLTAEGRQYSVLVSEEVYAMPTDVCRAVGVSSPTLTKRKTEVTVTVQGRLFPSSVSSISLQRGESIIQSTSVDIISNEKIEATFSVDFVETDSTLSFGEEYTLKSVPGDDEVIVREGVVVVVPSPPFISSITPSPHPSSPTQFSLIFEGQNLPSGLVFLAHVESNPPIPVTISADGTRGTTPYLTAGGASLIEISKMYTVSSLTKEDDAEEHILLKHTTFATPSAPERTVFIVDSESTDTTRQCGSSISPCQSVDVVWGIVSVSGLRHPNISIHTAAQLESSLLISDQMSVAFSKDAIDVATLSFHSTATHQSGEGLIVVEGGKLSIDDVNVVIRSADTSFVFVSARKATIVLKGSFTGHPTSTNTQSDAEGEDEVCEWRSSAFQLDDCSTSVTFSSFSNLSQGAIQMTKGSLNIDTTAFHDNSPKLASFASLRRNIHCSEGGNVVVGTLSGGDGVLSHSTWFSLEGCSFDAPEEIKETPFFVPTLSNSSTSTHSKKKEFEIEIRGTTLIPCGLNLEVFEMDKDEKVGESTRLPLTLASTSSFTHTSITLTIPDSSLSSLSSSLAWRGRLVFGANQTTTESFVVQKSSADRIAQSAKENMKWWLPLILSLIALVVIGMLVVFLCWRHRKHNKTKHESEQPEQELQPEDKVEVEDNAVLPLQNMADQTTLSAFTDSEMNEAKMSSKRQAQDSTHLPVKEVLTCGEKCEVVTIPVTDTLFSKLHKQGCSFDKRAAQRQLTKGVNALVYLKPDPSAGI
ncbi:hypothetical protein BLNAU_8714 [Blattamonas nauphoetae]|uniref:Uncharacterized protein n=1 Tax=Blattamonas nauphoetae TaxID=2049346 RepID=A0ABQ9XY08_9EUKA|nr:hypothetical protein BLNAU_8714 [Blattamonas nauphoetae]